MEAPPSLPRSLRARVLATVVEALFVGYLAGSLLAALTSAVLMARACFVVFDDGPALVAVAGLALQGCKLGLLLFADAPDPRLTRAATGLLFALSVLASTAALADALRLPRPGAIAAGLLVAVALEATIAATFLGLHARVTSALTEADVLDGVARDAAAAFRQQEARHAGLRHDAAGHVQALRSALRADASAPVRQEAAGPRGPAAGGLA